MAEGSQLPAAVLPPQPSSEPELAENGASVPQPNGEVEAIKQDALAGAGEDTSFTRPVEGQANIHAGLTEEEQDALLKVMLKGPCLSFAG